MSVVAVLSEAKALVYRAHTPRQLAVNARGVNVRPLDPGAVAWSSTGALGKVAPWMSATDDRIWFDLTVDANEAFDLLNNAARLQGYRSDDLAPIGDVDRAGLQAVLKCFTKAMQLAPAEEHRVRRGRARVGSLPRGTEGSHR